MKSAITKTGTESRNWKKKTESTDTFFFFFLLSRKVLKVTKLQFKTGLS
jgi:hypothetical protein